MGAQIEEGRICALVFYGDFLAMRPLEDITSALEGCLMRREDVAAVLDGFPLNEYLAAYRGRNCWIPYSALRAAQERNLQQW